MLSLLALPPAAPLLVAALGLLLSLRARRTGWVLTFVGVAAMWLLSSSAVAGWLAQQLIPAYPPQSAESLKALKVQAIVVLGGGIVADMPEFGSPQPNGYTAARLRYGVFLARQTGLPMAYSGGVGWHSRGKPPPPPEGEVVARTLMQDYNQPLRWVDNRARDTQENAELLAALLQRDGIKRIALVTHYPHMPRSVLEFRRAGFDVIPAPTGYYSHGGGDWLAWLPSAKGLNETWYVLREQLGLEVAKARGPARGDWQGAITDQAARAAPPDAPAAPREPVRLVPPAAPRR